MRESEPHLIEERFISIVIPNRNGAASIGRCLAAAFASDYRRFEVVVVDDSSSDESLEIIGRFPCKLVRLDAHGGVSRARNEGAKAAAGELLLFIDNDCLLERGALAIANSAFGERRDRVLGGTYTPEPDDGDFFSAFQSIFINHFETKRTSPDYVAAHFMVVDASLFRRSGGFIESSFIGVAASVEDVELAHRLRAAGCELSMRPDLLVRHVFRFSLSRSLANAVKKARYWTMYSIAHRDLLSDSGTASMELKVNVVSGALAAVLVGASAISGSAWPLLAGGLAVGIDLFVNRRLFHAFRRVRGTRFSLMALLYYMTLYAAAVAVGGALGVAQYPWKVRSPSRFRSCAPRSGTCDLSS